MDTLKLIVMGPAGVGKSTVGQAIDIKLGVRYVDGDSLHPAKNIAKMAGGTPLSDADRATWIENILAELAGGSVVIGASLLKRNYRQKVYDKFREVRFAQLVAPVSVLSKRIQNREHFFRQDLLDSQMVIFDPLSRGEPGHVYDATKPVATLVSQIMVDLKAQ